MRDPKKLNGLLSALMSEPAARAQCKIILPRESETVLLETAILAATVAERHANIYAAMQAMSGAGQVIEPRRETAKYHAAKFKIFQELYAQQKKRSATMAKFSGCKWLDANLHDLFSRLAHGGYYRVFAARNASAFVAIRVAIVEYSPTHLALLRFLVTWGVLVFCAPFLKMRFPEKRDWIALALTGFCGGFVYQTLLNWGQKTVTAGSSAFLSAARF